MIHLVTSSAACIAPKISLGKAPTPIACSLGIRSAILSTTINL
uniref:Uncharacterized protein n=1 Tax=Arundo donax TaxID=35708 RepID=A0A0A9BKS7_ARUDO